MKGEILEIFTGKNKTQLASEMIDNMFDDKQMEIVESLSGKKDINTKGVNNE